MPRAPSAQVCGNHENVAASLAAARRQLHRRRGSGPQGSESGEANAPCRGHLQPMHCGWHCGGQSAAHPDHDPRAGSRDRRRKLRVDPSRPRTPHGHPDCDGDDFAGPRRPRRPGPFSDVEFGGAPVGDGKFDGKRAAGSAGVVASAQDCPMASATLLQMASPRPEPLDLVVTNGLKILSRRWSGMPHPVSEISTSRVLRPLRTGQQPAP